MRGSESLVRCSNCGRTVPRNKAVMDERMIRYGIDANNRDIRFQTSRKVHYCISCAKHKGIFLKKAEQAARHAARQHGGMY